MLGSFINRCINKGEHRLLGSFGLENLWKSWERNARCKFNFEGISFTPEASCSQKELCDQPCQSHSRAGSSLAMRSMMHSVGIQQVDIH